jgi:predicted dinucleotide-binding enzyme
MTTAIIGTGNIGGTLARHLVRGGEPTIDTNHAFSTRDVDVPAHTLPACATLARRESR